MPGDKKVYDCIASLGGFCAVAHNLRYRSKRPFSLPFDWVYMPDQRPVAYLIEGFKDNFKNLALKENLQRIAGNKSHAIIYKDTYSGYCFPNHFSAPLEEVDTYPAFYDKLKRRTERLIHALQTSKKALLILATEFVVEQKLLMELYQTLVKQFPETSISLRVMLFNSPDNKTYTEGENFVIEYFSRKVNDYDTLATNYEWAFMDQLEWSSSNPIISPLNKRLMSLSCFGYNLSLRLTRKQK